MSSVDPVVRLLADLDRPARPAVEFEDALLDRLLGQLEDAFHHEPQARATARSKGWGARVLRVVTRRPRTALALAAVTGVAAAALFVSGPWKTSPGFLERAQAALTATEPSVLHMKWETRVGTVRRCRPEEIWLDQPPPHRYRYLVDGPKLRKPECTGEPPIEFGGTQNTGGTLEFHPPNALIATQHKAFVPVDLVARLREAIGTGRAHDEGTTELYGRTVRRIRLDPPTSCPEVWPRCQETASGYIYVDPETFYPVALETPGFTRGRGVEILKIRYLEFEYLPRTAENLALTDIRAQHPKATVWP